MSCWNNIEGIWSYEDLIGAKFRLRAITLSTGGLLISGSRHNFAEDILYLKKVHFQVTTDGMIHPLFEMDGICDRYFKLRELELIEVYPISKDSTICGKIKCGDRVLIGTGVESEDDQHISDFFIDEIEEEEDSL